MNRRMNRGNTLLCVVCDTCAEKYDQSTILKLATALLDNGATPDVETEGKKTPLHLVAKSGMEKVGRLLLNRGCPLNNTDVNDETAMHVAVRYGHAAFIELMSDFGANCHVRNKLAKSALDMAEDIHDPLTGRVTTREELRQVILSLEPRYRTLVLFHEDCLAQGVWRLLCRCLSANR